MSVRAYDWAAERREVDYSARAVLLALAALANNAHVVRVAVPELSESADLSTRMVREIIAKLEQAKLIECVRPINAGGVGRYRLAVPSSTGTGVFA